MVSYQIYKAKLKNELAPSRKKTQFFSFYIIFPLSSKFSDLRPSSQINALSWPILELKRSVREVKKGHPVFVTQVDLIP